MTEYHRFDAAEYLENEEDIAAYLEEVSAGNDPGAIALALGAIARARNVSQLARETGMTRMGAYKALNHGGNPSLETIAKIADALEFELALRPKSKMAPAAKQPIRGARQAASPEASTPPAPERGKLRSKAKAAA